jgi:riboflavin biosynthesis pyrimidine reductase
MSQVTPQLLRRLLPAPAAEVDPYEAYGDVPARWLRVGMVLSLDGSVTDEEGWSNGLGGVADQWVFRVLRARADAILVGASTARTGRLGPAKLSAELRERRGRPPAPIVVFTRKAAGLDWSLPLFTAARTPTIVVTGDAAAVSASVPVVVTEDPAEAVRRLRDEHGLEHLLCEGGPSLATSLLRAGVVDELCLNVAPTLVGGEHHTRVLDVRGELDLMALYEKNSTLFLRYGVRFAR